MQAVNARSVERNGYGIPQPLLSRLHILARMATVLFPIGVWMRSSGTPPSASFVPDGTRSPWVVRFSEESGSRVLKTVTEVTVGRRIAASSSIH